MGNCGESDNQGGSTVTKDEPDIVLTGLSRRTKTERQIRDESLVPPGRFKIQSYVVRRNFRKATEESSGSFSV